MDRIWGRPGAGAPLSQEQKDFARKQKRKEICGVKVFKGGEATSDMALKSWRQSSHKIPTTDWN